MLLTVRIIVQYSGSINLDPAEIRVFSNAFYDFEAPEKKNEGTARCGGGLRSRLRIWFIRGPRCAKRT